MKEAILDSNILIRFLTADHEDHFKKSKAIFEEIENNQLKAVLSILVVNEVVWILENYYNIPRETYIPELLKILSLQNIKVLEINKNSLINILVKMRSNKFDFTDIYLFTIKGSTEIYSFDNDFKKMQKSTGLDQDLYLAEQEDLKQIPKIIKVTKKTRRQL